ncbi:MAG: F0F1 ATP synthase subunit B [Actinobacteria bacterium]|nr:F0F1 ATP synthase subunit B [Actinomycetota bacterium]
MEALGKIFNPLTSTLFWQIVAFVILWILLARFVFKPISNIIKKREDKISASVNEADKLKEEAEKMLVEYRKKLDEARIEAQTMVEQSKTIGENLKNELIERTKLESSQMIAEARREIERERDKALASIKENVVDLTLLATEKLIGKALREEDHLRLIEESIEEASKTK